MVWRGNRTTTLSVASSITAPPRRIARQFRLHLRLGEPALSPAPLLAWWRGRIVIESFRAFAHDAPPDKTLERAQRSVIFRRNEADCIADRERAAGASDAMDVILGVHGEIVIHDMRNSIHVDSARRDIGRHEHPHNSRFK